MERTFFSGNTLEQAVLAAARHHGLDPERVAYTLRDKKHGFLNIRRRVVIVVDPTAPEREAIHADVIRKPDQSANSNEGPGASSDRLRGDDRQDRDLRREERGWRGGEASWADSEHSDDEVEAIEEAVDQLGDLAGMKLTSSVRREGRGFEIELSGPDSGVLLEHQGSGLDAVEHLLPRLVRGLNGQGVPCRVDSDGFRGAREEELRRLARDTAEEVSQERVERRLEPMNPADRRQIHMALVDDPAVRTESEGEGFLKCVRVLPS